MATPKVESVSSEFQDTTLFVLAGTPITIATLVTFALILIVTWWSARLLEKGVEKALRLRGVTDVGTIGVTRRLLYYLVWIAGIAIGLQVIGIDLGALFAAGAVFAVAIGFAMQNLTQNFVSGVLLLMERTIKPGDVIEVEGRRVKITSMGIRATIARTKDDEDVIVPNSILVSGVVKNFTLKDPLCRIRVPVGVAYSSNIKQVHQTLMDVATNLPWRSPRHKPEVMLLSFGVSSVDFEVSAWIEDPWTFQSRKSDLHLAVWEALEEAQITIAFPQLDVHFGGEVSDALLQRTPQARQLPEGNATDGDRYPETPGND